MAQETNKTGVSGDPGSLRYKIIIVWRTMLFNVLQELYYITLSQDSLSSNPINLVFTDWLTITGGCDA